MPTTTTPTKANGAATIGVAILPSPLDVEVAGDPLAVPFDPVGAMVADPVGAVVAGPVIISVVEVAVAFVDSLEALILKSGDSLKMA